MKDKAANERQVRRNGNSFISKKTPEATCWIVKKPLQGTRALYVNRSHRAKGQDQYILNSEILFSQKFALKPHIAYPQKMPAAFAKDPSEHLQVWRSHASAR